MNDRKLWQVPDAAAQMSVSERTLARLVADGEIESIKIGRRRLIPDAALNDYIEKLRRAS